MKLIFFAFLGLLSSQVAMSQASQESDQALIQNPVSRFLRIQHSEDQGMLLDLAEGIKFGESVFNSNRLNLGIFFGSNLLTVYGDLIYGSTTLNKSRVEDVAVKFEADHHGLAYGLRFYREVYPFFLPYIGFERARFWGSISEKLEVGDTDDRVSIPLKTYDLRMIDIESLSLGIEMRIFFWKVLTLATATGLEIPIKVSEVKFKTKDDVGPDFIAAREKLGRSLKKPTVLINFSLGFSF